MSDELDDAFDHIRREMAPLRPEPPDPRQKALEEAADICWKLRGEFEDKAEKCFHSSEEEYESGRQDGAAECYHAIKSLAGPVSPGLWSLTPESLAQLVSPELAEGLLDFYQRGWGEYGFEENARLFFKALEDRFPVTTPGRRSGLKGTP